VGTLKSQLKDLKDKEEVNVERLRIMETQLRTLAEESSEMSSMKQKFKKIEAELSKEREEVIRLKNLESQHEAHSSSLEQTKEELRVSQSLFSTKTSELNAALARIQDLEQKIDTERMAHQRALASMISEKEKGNSNFSAQIRNAEQSANGFRKKLDLALADKEKLGNELAELKTCEEKLKVLVQESESKVTLMDSELQRNRQELEKAQNKIASLEKVASQVASVKELSSKLTDDLETLSNRETHLKQVNRSLKDEVRRLSRTGSGSNLSPGITPSPSTSGLANAAVPGPFSNLNGSRPLSNNSSASSLPRSSSKLSQDMETNGVPQPGMEKTTGSVKSSSQDMIADLREVNVTYLKSVVLSFMEKRQMRAHLVPVLQTLLQCTEDEVRRLETSIQGDR
jgi:hypothetical protein